MKEKSMLVFFSFFNVVHVSATRRASFNKEVQRTPFFDFFSKLILIRQPSLQATPYSNRR